jgi:hypothetical protein
MDPRATDVSPLAAHAEANGARFIRAEVEDVVRDGGRVTGLRLEVLPDASLGGMGPGRTKHGNFVLNRLDVSVVGAEPVRLVDAAADYSQTDWDVREALDSNAKAGKEGSGWAVGGGTGNPHHADFGFAEPIERPAGTELTLTLVQNYGEQHTLGRFRLHVLTAPTELALPAEVRAALAKPAADRTKTDHEAVARHVERVVKAGRRAV